MTDLRRTLGNRVRPLIRRLPTPVRRRVGRQPEASRPVPAPPRPRPPRLSVVVVLEADRAGLVETVTSVLAQGVTDLELIVVVPAELSPEAASLVEGVGSLDSRIRVLTSPGTSRSALANAGTAVATGAFLAFLLAGDIVPPAAYASSVASLRRTGSDFAVGAMTTALPGRAPEPDRVDELHLQDRPGVQLAEAPLAVVDHTLGNRVFRREFWVGTAGFQETADGLGLGVVEATLTATSFDVLRIETCRQPGLSRSTPAERPDNADLAHRLRALQAMTRRVRTVGDPALDAAWTGGLVDSDFGDLLVDTQVADAAVRAEIRATATELLTAADADSWAYVRLDRKLRLWLAAGGRWTDLDLLVHHFRLYGEIPETEVVDGRVYGRRDGLPAAHEAPQDCLELSRTQTALTGGVERVSWAGARLTVTGWAFIRGIDLSPLDLSGPDAPTLRAELVDPVTGDTQPCEVEQVEQPAANRGPTRARYQDVARSGFVLRLDTAVLPDRAARWVLAVTVEAAGVRRTGGLHTVVTRGAGRRMPSRDLADDTDPGRLLPQLDPELGFLVQVRPERLRARALWVDGAVVGGELQTLDDRSDPLTAMVLSSSAGELTASLEPDEAGGRRFTIELPPGTGAHSWELRARDTAGRRHRVSWPARAEDGRVFGDSRTGWVRSTRAWCGLVTGLTAAEAVRVEVTEGRLEVTVRLAGIDPVDARLAGPFVDLPASDVAAGDDGEVRLGFPLRAARWGRPTTPLPGGEYRVTVGGHPVTCPDALLARLPADGVLASHAYEVGRAGSGFVLTVTLGPPRLLSESSLVVRQRAGERYTRLEVRPTDAVLFQCYRGDFVTDSQLALHHELRRRGGLELLWSVRDLSVPVPEGGRGVLIESPEWYEALAASRYLCTNVDFERSFRKRPHQRYLQTFHGYPWKSMGASLWRAQGRPEGVIAVERARRGSAWDAILVPTEFAAELYRREYGFTGQILVTGYPRNDSLFAPDAARVRERVREQLGVTPGQTVVLYAPTWRDTTATSAWSAALFDQLDLERLAAQLGPDYVVWLRGHNYNVRGGLTVSSAAVTDVSAYPEINDLILAADAAVLDYSSLRFDWLLTGKPVVFFVPDLEDYLTTRTVLYDYAPTAPGPQLRTTDEVGAALLDLDTVSARYAAARDEFNERFNTLNDGHAGERVVDAFFR